MMHIIKPYVYLDENELSGSKLKLIERAARLCYKSEDKIREGSAEELIQQLLNRGHESIIEHEKATVFFVADRGITHEIVRHRIASYSQESTRYCNYSSSKFGKEITVICPFFYEQGSPQYLAWEESCLASEKAYMALIEGGKAQEARTVLPNSLKTEIAVTFNFREWRHFFRLRCSSYAHPQMQQLTIPLLLHFQSKLPCLFDDIDYNRDFPKEHYAVVETPKLIL